MKRLLTCLFLVLGLGLVFSVNAKAKSACVLIMELDDYGIDGYKFVIVAQQYPVRGSTPSMVQFFKKIEGGLDSVPAKC